MRTLKVCGRAAGSAPADTVELTVQLESRSKDYAELDRLNADRYARLEKAAASCGLGEHALKTASFNVSTEYDYNSARERVFTGYCMQQQLKIRFAFTSELLNRVLSALSDCGAEAAFDLRFVCGSWEQVRARLQQAAVRDAFRTAQTLAEAAQLNLGAVAALEYGPGRGEPLSATEVRPAMLRAAAVNVTPEDVQAEERVQITWEI